MQHFSNFFCKLSGIIFFTLVSYLQLAAQENGELKFIAIAIDISDVKGQVFDSIYKKLEKSILDRNNQGLILYNWNESNSEVIYSGKNKIAERPVNSVLFMKASGFFDMYPPLKAQFDTLGNLTNMFLEMKRHLTFHVSHVDVATGVQIKNEQIDLIPSKKTQINIQKFRDYFKGDAAAVVRNKGFEYSDAEEKIRQVYAERIPEHYMPALDIKEKLDYFSNKTFNLQKDYYNTYLPPDYNGELEYVLIDAGKHSNFKKGTWVYLYEKKIFNEKYHYYKYIGVGTAKEIRENETVVKSIVPGKKRVKSLLEAKENVIALHKDELSVRTKLNAIPSLKKVNVSVVSDKADKNIILSSVEKCPGMKLVTRSFPEMKYFDNLYKRENTLSLESTGTTLKKEGYSLLIKDTGKYFNVIKAETGEIMMSILKKDLDISTLKDVHSDELINLGPGINIKILTNILYAYDPEAYKTIWIENVKYSEKKISSIRIFNPGGFENTMHFDIYQIDIEIADGIETEKSTKIATGWTKDIYSDTIARLYIGK